MHTGTQHRTGRIWWSRGWVLGVLLGLLGGWQPCQAAEFTCPDGDSGVACVIAAINDANANGEENTITLEAGTYTLTAVDNFTDRPNGLPSITSTLTISGAGADTPIIERQAGSTPEFRLLHVAATGRLTLDGLALSGGFLSSGLRGGGGISNNGILTLTNCTLTHNTVDGNGGGIESYGPLTLTNSTLAYNTAYGGGGIFHSGDGPLTLTNSTLAHNTASFFMGGGLYNSGAATLTSCTLTDNTSTYLGGGLYNSGYLTLTNCNLTHNTSSANGGGISNFFGILTLTNSTLAHNTATANGGGIESYGPLTLTNSTLAYNTATKFRGGGLYNIGTATLTNSTLAYNTANSGGGIYSPPSSTTLQYTLLQNTILALNTTPEASPQANDCVGGVTSLGTNLIGHPTECPITLQANDLTGNPGLDAFTTGDGAPGHGHFPLQQTSQAIDAGNDDICPDIDQLGQPRVGQCDIGAIEYQPSDTTPPTVTIVSVTPDTLWPPNGKLVPVTIVATITDTGSGVDSDTVTYTVLDEYGRVQPSGSLTLGKQNSYTGTVYLQASRNDNDRNGRHYTITVSAHDTEGNEGSADAIVTVPHDQGRSLATR